VPLATKFTAQILVFDIAFPLIAGVPVSLVLFLIGSSTNSFVIIARTVSSFEQCAGYAEQAHQCHQQRHHRCKTEPSVSLSSIARSPELTFTCGGSVLQKGVHAEVEISLRAPTQSSSTRAPVIPLEPAHINKEMGRILLRRGGETVAAGELSTRFRRHRI
jgi:elongation factor 1 alpha-like protein